MLSEDELLHVLALQHTPNLGAIFAKKLITTLGSAQAVFSAKKNTLSKIEGIGAIRIQGLNAAQQLDAAEEELAYIKANQIAYSYFLDESYPKRLAHCVDGPILFFKKGAIDLTAKSILSIVGTRRATVYGINEIEKILEEIAPINPVIVSGFAYGIDIAAQKKAMELGLQTIACLAHGLNQIYPKHHKRYESQVMANGGFITEFWSSSTFNRTNFLQRNRIIAGLSEATLVVESAEKGGSLVTADIANSYHRDVFAIPGRIRDPQSQGCNNLIKTQRAQMITSGADLLYHLGWNTENVASSAQQKQLFVALSSEEQVLWNYLENKEQAGLDTIALHCKMPTFKVASLLLTMELKGVIKPLPGKQFQSI